MAHESAPPLPVRLFARGSAVLVSRFPGLWPLLRRPTQAFWQRAASRWDDRTAAESDERIAVLEDACEHIDPPRRILELGTGTGRGALMLAARFPGAEIDAVDLSAAMVEQARSKVGADQAARIRFEVGDASDLRFEDGTFDLVCQLNLPLFAEEVARVAAPGGHVLIASSHGADTPYFTPDRVVRRLLGKHGVSEFVSGAAGPGTYVLGRRG